MTDSATRCTDSLTDDQLFHGLRTTDLPAGDFHHREHLRAGWLYLERWSLPEALARFSVDLKALATSNGALEKFHTTVTWALLFALDARRRELGPGHTWQQLAELAPELLDWKGFLARYYTDTTLWSDEARVSFLLPDRLAPADLPATDPTAGLSPATAAPPLD